MLEISLIEVLPGIIHAAELARVTPHSRVLIMGQGVSGLVITQVFKMYSPASLVVTDIKARNLALGAKYGASHTYRLPNAHASTMDAVGADFPDGFDIVVPCLLEGDGMKDALDCCALGGRIIMYGCIGTCKEFDFFKMHRRRVEIYSTEPRRDIDMRRYFEEGVRMVLDGVVNSACGRSSPCCRRSVPVRARLVPPRKRQPHAPATRTCTRTLPPPHPPPPHPSTLPPQPRR